MNPHSGLHNRVRATLPYLILHLNNANDRILVASGTVDGDFPLELDYPGLEIYLRREKIPQTCRSCILIR